MCVSVFDKCVSVCVCMRMCVSVSDKCVSM